MPRSSSSIGSNCEAITRLVAELIANGYQDLPANTSAIALALNHPDTGELESQVRLWFEQGCHHLDRKRVRDELERSGVSNDELAKSLNVSSTTVWRWLERGNGSAAKWDAFLATFSKELVLFKPATANEKFMAGYCEAITFLRREVHDALNRKRPLPLVATEFCYLWHSINNEFWMQAIRKRNQTMLDQSSRQIHQNVQTTFPSDEAAVLLPAAKLLRLFQDWHLWYSIVICCKAPR